MATGHAVPHNFGSAAELLAIAETTGHSLETIVLANEDAFRPRAETQAGLDHVAAVMLDALDGEYKRIDEAIAHFRRALKAAPGHVQAHRNLARALACRGQLSEAVAHYREAQALAVVRGEGRLADELRGALASFEDAAQSCR